MWESIKSNFLSAYKDVEEIVGLSVKQEVTANDEWCAEAYMQTDYSTITDRDFEQVVKKYAIFKAVGVETVEVAEDEYC